MRLSIHPGLLREVIERRMTALQAHAAKQIGAGDIDAAGRALVRAVELWQLAAYLNVRVSPAVVDAQALEVDGLMDDYPDIPADGRV